MSAITDFAAAVNTRFDVIETKTDAAVASINGVKDDVVFLKEELAKLQQDPNDTAALAAVLARADSLATKVTAASDALAELDSQTTRPTPPA